MSISLLARRHFFVLKELVRRDFQSRFAGSFLGLFWSLVQPIWQLLLFSFVFSTVLKVSPVGERTTSFAVFLFAGLLPWLAFHEGIVRATTAMTDNAPLVKKLAFPPQVYVVSVVVAAFLQQVVATVVFLLVLVVMQGISLSALLWLLVAVPLQLALTLGLALLLAALQVFLRDTVQFVSLALAGWFYLTPIVYPLAYVPPGLRPWLSANPFTGLVGLYRAALVGGEVAPWPTVSLLLSALSALVVGYWVFSRLRPGFVDSL